MQEVREVFGVVLWKAIRGGWEQFKLRNSISVENGSSVKVFLVGGLGRAL